MTIAEVLEVHFPEVNKATRELILWSATDFYQIPKESSIDRAVLVSKQLTEFRQHVAKKMISGGLPIEDAVSLCLVGVYDGDITLESWL